MSLYIPPVVRFDQVRAVPIRWLWEPYLARGKLAVLDGDVGSESRSSPSISPPGCRAVDGCPTGRGGDQGGRSVPQRRGWAGRRPPAALEAAGADLKRIFSLGGIRLEDPAGGGLSFPQHLDRLHRAVVAHEPELVVVDPMTAFFPPEVSANNDQTTRRPRNGSTSSPGRRRREGWTAWHWIDLTAPPKKAGKRR